MSSPATAGNQPEENCVVCGKPTTSHAVPAGWLCHTCLTEEDEDDVLDELAVPPVRDLDADTDLTCHWCGHEHTPREANTPGRNHVAAMLGESPFEALDALLIVSCPHCGRATEYLTTELSCRDVIEALDLRARQGVGR
jgi:DNA-directed RNA polymerase subunit RPC12/RpoP